MDLIHLLEETKHQAFHIKPAHLNLHHPTLLPTVWAGGSSSLEFLLPLRFPRLLQVPSGVFCAA